MVINHLLTGMILQVGGPLSSCLTSRKNCEKNPYVVGAAAVRISQATIQVGKPGGQKISSLKTDIFGP